jgi:hypothetical protein
MPQKTMSHIIRKKTEQGLIYGIFVQKGHDLRMILCWRNYSGVAYAERHQTG